MSSENENAKVNSLTRLTAILLGLPWVELVPEAWKLGRKILRGLADEGMAEVLELESTLELLDKTGKNAIYRKRKKVRYLHNDIIAYQDSGWAEGKYFIDYQVSPGVAVDRYKASYTTYILISLRGIRNKGDIDEFHIQWKIKDGFLKPDGFWQTDVNSRTKQMKVSIIFPKGRPPQSVRLVENNIRRTSVLGADSTRRLSDGRWQATWETERPRLYEQYILRWDW